MKKEINIEQLLSKKNQIKIPENVDTKCKDAILRASEQKIVHHSFSYLKPLMGIAAILVVFMFIVNPGDLTKPQEYVKQTLDVPKEIVKEPSEVMLGDDNVSKHYQLYDKEVQTPDIKITSLGCIITWTLPQDENFKEIRIERIDNTISILVYTGEGQIFIDNEFDPEVTEFYRITAVDRKNQFSSGITIEIPED